MLTISVLTLTDLKAPFTIIGLRYFSTDWKLMLKRVLTCTWKIEIILKKVFVSHGVS